MQIGICDDNLLVATQLESQLNKFLQKENLVYNIEVFTTPQRLINTLEDHVFDVLFLDIEMGEITGIDVGRYLRQIEENHYTTVIFFSSYTSYHEELFGVTPSGFLKKPVDYNELTTVMNPVLKRLRLRTKEANSFFVYKKGGETNLISAKDILYFESIKRQVKIVYKNNDSILEDLFYSTMEETAQRLVPRLFFQVHRSYIVNLAQVTATSSSDVILNKEIVIPIGRKYRKDFLNALSNYHLEGI